MEASTIVHGLAESARTAARTLLAASADERSSAVRAIADALEAHSERILLANSEDMKRGESSGMHRALHAARFPALHIL